MEKKKRFKWRGMTTFLLALGLIVEAVSGIIHAIREVCPVDRLDPLGAHQMGLGGRTHDIRLSSSADCIRAPVFQLADYRPLGVE